MKIILSLILISLSGAVELGVQGVQLQTQYFAK